MCSSWHPQQCIVGIVKVESRPNQDAPPVAAFQRQRCPPVPEGLRDELAGLLSVAHGNSETSAQTLSRPLITFCSLSSLLNCWNNESRITADIKGKLSTTFSVFFFSPFWIYSAVVNEHSICFPLDARCWFLSFCFTHVIYHSFVLK